VAVHHELSLGENQEYVRELAFNNTAEKTQNAFSTLFAPSRYKPIREELDEAS